MAIVARRHPKATPLSAHAGRPSAGGNLPARVSSFIGRERELAELERLTAEARLVTLTGPGGSGKTRLAIELAERIGDRFASGAWFVDLAPIRDSDIAVSTISTALGIHPRPGWSRLDLLVDRLTQLPTLLLLDNLEQLHDAAALVADLLGRCAGLHVLATSRASLHVRGEHEVLVDPLALPDPASRLSPEELLGNEAVALYVDRARSAHSGFALDADNARAVVGICRRLDGLPLAIELAAARSRLLGPEALLRRIGPGLALLRSEAPDAPARQRTMRDTIAWSYELLDDAERRIFERCSVFAASFSIASAEAVLQQSADREPIEIFEALDRLVDLNLLRVAPGTDGEPRFRLLETVREFAGIELSSEERDALRERHARHFLSIVEDARRVWGGPEQPDLRDDLDNIRAALNWAQEVDAADVLARLTVALARMWPVLGGSLTEADRWFHAAEGLAADLPLGLRAALREGLVMHDMFLGTDRRSVEPLVVANIEAYTHLGDSVQLARTLLLLCNIKEDQDEPAAATELTRRALEVTRAVADPRERGLLLALTAFSCHSVLTVAEGLALGEEALELGRQINDWPAIVNGLLAVGYGALALGDATRAADATEEVLSIQRRSSGDLIRGTMLLALCKIELGDSERSRQLLHEARELANHYEALWYWIDLVEVCACWLGKTGHHAEATMCWAAVDAQRSRQVDRTYFDTVGFYVSPRDRDRSAISPSQYAQARLAGERMRLSDALDFGIAAVDAAAHPRSEDAVSFRSAGEQLTSRELEVLQLVAAGRSDSEIAAALFISKKTAAVHVSNIKGKLGAANRVEVATRAMRDGLATVDVSSIDASPRSLAVGRMPRSDARPIRS